MRHIQRRGIKTLRVRNSLLLVSQRKLNQSKANSPCLKMFSGPVENIVAFGYILTVGALVALGSITFTLESKVRLKSPKSKRL
jgi:hypothetical protein